MRGSRKFSQGGVQIPRRSLTENFNMAKINNLAMPGGGGGGGGGGTPVPPYGSAHDLKPLWNFFSHMQFTSTEFLVLYQDETCKNS